MKKLDLENAFAQKPGYSCELCLRCSTLHKTTAMAIIYDEE